MRAFVAAAAIAAVLLQVASAGTLPRPGANATAPLQTCGGNCPSGDCPGCPCGTAVARVDIATMCAQYSGWNRGCCECIMSHESGGNEHAANYNSNGSYDVGLWQINDVNWSDCNGGAAPCDSTSNLRCAIDVWKWGGSFKLWSTCGGCGCC